MEHNLCLLGEEPMLLGIGGIDRKGVSIRK